MELLILPNKTIIRNSEKHLECFGVPVPREQRCAFDRYASVNPTVDQQRAPSERPYLSGKLMFSGKRGAEREHSLTHGFLFVPPCLPFIRLRYFTLR